MSVITDLQSYQRMGLGFKVQDLDQDKVFRVRSGPFFPD